MRTVALTALTTLARTSQTHGAPDKYPAEQSDTTVTPRL